MGIYKKKCVVFYKSYAYNALKYKKLYIKIYLKIMLDKVYGYFNKLAVFNCKFDQV